MCRMTSAVLLATVIGGIGSSQPAATPKRGAKTSRVSRNKRGAATPGILMSVCRTLKNRGLDPLQTVLDALRTYATTGALPPLPKMAGSGS